MAPSKKQTSFDIDFTLRRVFRKPSFRPYQREIITAAVEGHDVFVQAATSFGKSLCFQLPAVIDHGITIVVSPLLALMDNQVAALQAANIAVATINSNTTYEDRNTILDDLKCGHPRTRLLYVTPEFCQAESFRRHLQTIHSHGELARIAIDEAHCISEWGHEFRRAYCQLSYFRETYPTVPIICLTATATPRVRQDVISALHLDPLSLKSFATSVSRPNLHCELRFWSDEHDNRYSTFLTWLRAIHTRRATDLTRKLELTFRNERPTAVSGIIYVSTRTDCLTLASRLRDSNIGAAPYHAGLSARDRADCQTKWLANEPTHDIIVATTAFGMGIDKEDVRFVVHWSIPKSFEGYYQEAGRAGRDGKAAACILYYSREDRDRCASRIGREGGNGKEGRAKSFQKLVQYCEGVGCRHRGIGEYFGDAGGECVFACDACKDGRGVRRGKEDLASEEWCSTQREKGEFGEGWD